MSADIEPVGDHQDVAVTAAIAIIGSGFCGLAMGIELRRRGIDDFVILEAASGVGGTWRDNIYPGAEVDTPSHLYSFSTFQYDWTRSHCVQAELLAYMEAAARHFGLAPHFRFNETVVSSRWDEASQTHLVTNEKGITRRFRIVVSAVGFLSRPFVPEWARGGDTTIRVVHSAQWPRDLDLTGLRVGVVGTGSTAVQVVAEGSKIAKELLVFQRDPNWVLPKGTKNFSSEERRRYKSRWRQKLSRLRAYVAAERSKFFGEQRVGASANQKLHAQAKEFIETAFRDRPDLKAKITPNYPFLGKRQVYSDTYYAALNRPNVQVLPAVRSIDGNSVVDVAGARHELDVLVLATGFLSTDYLGAIRINGRSGRDLHEFWAGEASAFLGMTVPGFPNFFMLYGPNTNTGPLVTMFEAQAKYIADVVKPILAGKAGAVDVRRDVYDEYNVWIQKKLADTTWMHANNYFKTKSGKIVTQWPGPVTPYLVRLLLSRRRSHQYEPGRTAGAMPDLWKPYASEVRKN